MTRYTSDAANEIAKLVGKSKHEPPRVAAARRLIESAAPGPRRDDVVRSVYGDAQSPDEVTALLHLVHEIGDEAPPEPASPYHTGEPAGVPYGGFQAIPPAARVATETAGEVAYDEFLERAQHENGFITDEDRRAAAALADRIDAETPQPEGNR